MMSFGFENYHLIVFGKINYFLSQCGLCFYFLKDNYPKHVNKVLFRSLALQNKNEAENLLLDISCLADVGLI